MSYMINEAAKSFLKVTDSLSRKEVKAWDQQSTGGPQPNQPISKYKFSILLLLLVIICVNPKHNTLVSQIHHQSFSRYVYYIR